MSYTVEHVSWSLLQKWRYRFLTAAVHGLESERFSTKAAKSGRAETLTPLAKRASVTLKSVGSKASWATALPARAPDMARNEAFMLGLDWRFGGKKLELSRAIYCWKDIDSARRLAILPGQTSPCALRLQGNPKDHNLLSRSAAVWKRCLAAYRASIRFCRGTCIEEVALPEANEHTSISEHWLKKSRVQVRACAGACAMEHADASPFSRTRWSPWCMYLVKHEWKRDAMW